MTTQAARPGFFRRFFALPNVVAVMIGFLVFAVGLRVWPSNRGAILAALVAGASSSLVWLAWNRIAGQRPVGKLIDLPHVGTIPATYDGPAPTLTEPASVAAAAYQRAASRLEASIKGRVLLVSSLTRGVGATNAALNLAVAATRAGRRTLLIDGDLGRGNLSRFGRTGTSPGLAEVASGSATLAESARMWEIDEASRMPFVPAGHTVAPETVELPALTSAIGGIAAAADMVLIDAGTSGNGAGAALGPVAHGTLLVVPKAADRSTIETARERATTIGAPAIGYLVNEGAPSPRSIDQHPILRSLKRATAAALLVLGAYTAWNGVQIWDSWTGVGRQGFDVEQAGLILSLPEEGIVADDVDEDVVTAVSSAPVRDTGYLSVLVIGSDLSGNLADVIMLGVLPNDGSEPMLVSLPRDLYLPNRCTQTYTKLNANLAGCRDEVNGPTLLALAVSSFTGLRVDHFALFDFNGFEKIIDELGGIEICVDHPVRDGKADLDLPAGCTQASGAQTLAWVRSRRTQELVNGRWRVMANVSDITRNERQQDILLEMFRKLGRFSSPADLTSTVRSLTDAFTLDDQLGLTDAIGLAWSLRDLDPETIVTLQIPVRSETTAGGAAILVPEVPFDEVLAEGYPLLVPAKNAVSLDPPPG